jgi:hypothetical protein
MATQLVVSRVVLSSIELVGYLPTYLLCWLVGFFKRSTGSEFIIGLQVVFI